MSRLGDGVGARSGNALLGKLAHGGLQDGGTGAGGLAASAESGLYGTRHN